MIMTKEKKVDYYFDVFFFSSTNGHLHAMKRKKTALLFSQLLKIMQFGNQ